MLFTAEVGKRKVIKLKHCKNMKTEKTKNETNPKFGVLRVIGEDFVNLSSEITDWYNHQTPNPSYHTTLQYLQSTRQ